MNLRAVNQVKWLNLNEKFTNDQMFFNEFANQLGSIITRLPCDWNIIPNIDGQEQCLNNNSVQILNFKDLSRFDPWFQNPQSKIDYLFADNYRKTLETNGYRFRQFSSYCYKSNSYSEKPIFRNECDDFKYEGKFQRRILPFFISNSRHYDNATVYSNPVTLTTQVSFDRIDRIEETCRHWQGPMSVAVYLTDAELINLLQLMANEFSCLLSAGEVQLHLVFKHTPKYPTNMLRNVAMKFVETPYVFIVDADFLPYGNLQSLSPDLFPEPSSPSLVVIPAFELIHSAEYVIYFVSHFSAEMKLFYCLKQPVNIGTKTK